jgi:hypothetical protein
MMIAVAALALTALACDPGYDVTVQVVDSSGNPVPDVEVQVDCPPGGLQKYKHHMALGATDRTGSVHRSGIGEINLKCWIDAPQEKSDRIDVAAWCKAKHPYLGVCSRLSATLHLIGKAGGGA